MDSADRSFPRPGADLPAQPQPHPQPTAGRNIALTALIHAQARVAADAQIGEFAVIEAGVSLQERVCVGHGVCLPAGMTVEAGVVIESHAAFSRTMPAGEGQDGRATVLRSGAFVGANATIGAGLTLGAHCRVAPGAVVTRDVPPNAIVSGNPAHITGYVNTPHMDLPGQSALARAGSSDAELPALHVKRAALHRLPKIVDLRGALSFGEIGAHLPFEPKRFFMVYDVPSREVRGEHAHKACHQFLVCVKGSCGIVVDDGQFRDEILLDSARVGLHIPPMVWGIQYQFSSDAVLLVLASDTYSAEDYIRNYDEFLRAVQGGHHGE